MKLADLDRAPDYSPGLGPLGTCLQWLDTLTKSPTVPWDAGQLAAALQALQDARTLMLADPLALVAERHGAPVLGLLDAVRVENVRHSPATSEGVRVVREPQRGVCMDCKHANVAVTSDPCRSCMEHGLSSPAWEPHT